MIFLKPPARQDVIAYRGQCGLIAFDDLVSW